MKKILFLALCLCCTAAVPAAGPVVVEDDELIDDEPGEPFGEPIFPDEMIVSLWNDSVPVCYQHRDTIAETEYGRCINFNQLNFEPDGEKGIIMTWHAIATFANGFTGECTYIYRGTRDVNIINLISRKFSDDVNDEDVEILDPSTQAVTVDLFSHTQLRFNNRTFNRISCKPGENRAPEEAQ